MPKVCLYDYQCILYKAAWISKEITKGLKVNETKKDQDDIPGEEDVECISKDQVKMERNQGRVTGPQIAPPTLVSKYYTNRQGCTSARDSIRDASSTIRDASSSSRDARGSLTPASSSASHAYACSPSALGLQPLMMLGATSI
nr:PREDICTED: uncharacterized protein LOC106703707 [Latimeria chalumnae]|eukprot:XP_014344550.1 PREDICTED: uncharacterized protein LOC106703707 [Latimeria chalumnae]